MSSFLYLRLKLLKMKKALIILLYITLFFAISCKKDEFGDPNYPTTIKELSADELNQLLDQLEQTPLSELTSLDPYGFPFSIIGYQDSINNETWRFKTTYEELVELTKKTVTEYGYFLNVTDSSLVTIKSVSTVNNMKYEQFVAAYPDSLPPVWKITVNQQLYQGIEVRGTTLTFLFSPNGIVSLGGHWFNNIYIPDSLRISDEDAKNLIIDQLVTYKNVEFIPTAESYWHNTRKVILPIRMSDQIELRVCWALYPETWEIIVDALSGKTLSAVNIGK